MSKRIKLKDYTDTTSKDKTRYVIIETCANKWYSECDGGGVNCPCCHESHKHKNLTCFFDCEPMRDGIPDDCPLEDV